MQTTTAIIAFLHAMFLFPDIAEKVYKEIDEVTNGQRLPQVTDRPSLSFTEAAWKEAWRWHPFLPIGVLNTLV
jgi:cytochrome P450